MRVKPFLPRRPRVEMVPLIDMFFLLLVFFIFGVFSMTMQQGLLVELPAAATAASSREETVTVSVAADGTLALDREPVALPELAGRLRALPPGEGERLVIINADRHAAHGLVVSVLDAVRQAGLARVSIQAEAPRE